MQEGGPKNPEADSEPGPNQLTPDEEMEGDKPVAPAAPEEGHEGDEWVRTGQTPDEETPEK